MCQCDAELAVLITYHLMTRNRHQKLKQQKPVATGVMDSADKVCYAL